MEPSKTNHTRWKWHHYTPSLHLKPILPTDTNMLCVSCMQRRVVEGSGKGSAGCVVVSCPDPTLMERKRIMSSAGSVRMVSWSWNYVVKIYCCWTWQMWIVFYAEDCGVQLLLLSTAFPTSFVHSNTHSWRSSSDIQGPRVQEENTVYGKGT